MGNHQHQQHTPVDFPVIGESHGRDWEEGHGSRGRCRENVAQKAGRGQGATRHSLALGGRGGVAVGARCPTLSPG